MVRGDGVRGASVPSPALQRYCEGHTWLQLSWLCLHENRGRGRGDGRGREGGREGGIMDGRWGGREESAIAT